MSRSMSRVFLASTLFGLAAGVLSALLPLMATDVSAIPIASAQTYCGVTPCGGSTVTSALDVYHRVDPGGITDDPVQLDDRETVSITAHWSLANVGGACSCGYATSKTVTIIPILSGTSWSGTCSGCDPTNGPIRSVTICDINADACEGYDGDYRLNVVVDQAYGTGGAGCSMYSRFINRVVYTITEIDDGDDYNATLCVLGTAVGPTTNSFTATDSGTFECSANCEQGPSLTITFN